MYVGFIGVNYLNLISVFEGSTGMLLKVSW